MEMIKRFLKEEDGMGTVEIVLIIAVLVAIALIFKTQITEFVSKTLEQIFGDAKNVANTGVGGTTP